MDMKVIRQRFQQYLTDQCSHEFAWGRNDCLRFALDYYDRFRGTSLLFNLPQYGSEIEAKKVLIAGKRAYIEELDEGLLKAGFERTDEKLPENMVMIHGPSGFTLGLRMNEDHICLREKRGVTVAPNIILTIVEEWRLCQ